MGRLRTNIIVLFLGIILTVWTLNALGALRIVDMLAYDLYVRTMPADDDRLPVLLVEAPEEALEKGGRYWNDFLDELQGLGAEQIVFLFMPPDAGPGFYARAVADGNVVFGRSWSSGRFQSESQLTPVPEVAKRLPIISGLVTLPPSFYGVHRSYSAYANVRGEKVPTIVTVAVKDRFGSRAAFDEDFMVYFSGLDRGMPNVEISDVMKGKLVGQLVSGKSVIVGIQPGALVPGLNTPITLYGEGMSNLDYIGYALNTQLQDLRLVEASNLAKLAIIAAATLIALVILHYTNIAIVMIAIGVLSIVYIAATWLVFYHFEYWTPIVAILLAQGLSFLLVLRAKVNQQEAQVQLTVLETLHLIRKKVHPTSFMASEEHWAQVLNLVNQTLYMNRVIFLEPIENEHRVKEIIALNCSIDDIAEMRRDYQRSPYT